MDTILRILLGESYSSIRALTDLSVCVNKYQHAFGTVAGEIVTELTTNLAKLFIFCFIFSFSMDNTPIYQYAKPTSTSLKPPESSDPIITPGYELCLYFIKLIQDKSFSGEGNENPYSHLQEFEQTCACLCIANISNKTLR